MEIRDVRALSEIAAEFEGLEWLERKSEEQGNLRMEGYTKLIQIKLTSNGTIEIVLDKP